MGVVIGLNSSSLGLAIFALLGGVLGRLPFLLPGFRQRLILPLPILSLFLMFGVAGTVDGDCGVGGILEPKFINPNAPSSFSPISLPSLALLLVVGANPLSLFPLSSSLSSTLLNAGCVSVGGALGGATVTGMGGLAGRVSS
jgi:hypothetical protein